MGVDMYCDFLAAGAYFVITVQLVFFAHNPKVLAIFENRAKNRKAQILFYSAGLACFLFASFIALCGTTHLIGGFHRIFPANLQVMTAKSVVMVICAFVSLATAVVCVSLLPTIAESLSNVKLDSHGKFQLAESYMVEIVNMLKESVVVLAPDSRILRGNDTSAAIFGKNFLHQQVAPLVHREDRTMFETALGHVVNGMADQGPISIEYRVNTPELSSFTIASASVGMTSAPFIWVESTFCKGTHLNSAGQLEDDVKMITRSIDDRKRGARYRQYYEAAKEKEYVNEAKLRYISCVAHDLKTPLQSFCFTTDLLRQTDLNTEQVELVEQANVALDLMKLTISQTMDISKALTGAKLQPRRTSVLLSRIIARVHIIINGYGKQVPVTFTIDENIADAIITDEEWLWQMLLNLLTNACKYTDTGSIDVRVSLTVDTQSEKTSTALFPGLQGALHTSGKTVMQRAVMDMSIVTGGRNLLFEVIDTGVGIRDDKLDSVFDAFSQVQSGQVTGTGLGLFGVRRRVEGLGGTCGARHNTTSSTGSGTVMWFSIPYVVDHAEAMLASSSSGGGESRASFMLRNKSVSGLTVTPISPSRIAAQIKERNLTAIVVDDTLTIRKLMEKSLLQLGFASVVGYENGSKGLAAMMERQVDFVFTDIQMPIMTGPEMARRFRLFELSALGNGERQTRQTIVAVSANKPDASEASDADFDFICSKPLSRDDLSRLMHQWLKASDAAANV